MKLQKTKAFTLVELIIVITILAILRTIGFMSFQSYTLDARDGKRKRDLQTLRKGLEIYGTKNQTLLSPDNYTTISGASLQGYAGTNVLKTLRISDDAKDPKDKEYYTYAIDLTGKKYQLLSMLEKQQFAYNKILNQTYARDYTTRFPYIIGRTFGIYLSGTTQTPVQEGNSGTTIISTGSLTLITSNTGASSGGSEGRTFTCGTSTVTAGGYTYNTKLLVGKCWTIGSMKHGTLLANGSTKPSDINTIEKWCPMPSGTDGTVASIAGNCDTYSGALYTWYEAMGLNYTDTTITIENTSKSICGQLGAGWHLPSDIDWTALTTAGATGWTGNKLSGLISSIPGIRSYFGIFASLNFNSLWRSSTRYSVSDSLGRLVSDTIVSSTNAGKLDGYPVLCVNN